MRHFDYSASAIYGMMLAKIEIVGQAKQLSVCQVVIDSRQSFFELFRRVGRDAAYPIVSTPNFSDLEKLAEGLTMERTLEAALIAENKLQRDRWQIYDCRPTLEINGLRSVSHYILGKPLVAG